MTDGLKSEYRRAIIETLSANPKVERVVLFGSRAMGTFTPTSDIDLALFGDDLTLSDQAALAEAMAELAIPQRVDILIHHRIENQALREHIRKHGVEWFARKQASGTPAAARVRRNYSSNRPKPPNSTPPSPPTSRSWGMGDEWREVRIEEIAERVAMGPFGSSIKVETFVPEGVPVISGQHLHGFKVDDTVGFNFITPEHAERLKNASVQRGDIVLTHRGNIGQVAYIPDDSKYERYVVSQSQFYMRCDRSKVIPEFVVAFFKTPEGQHRLLANTSQVGVPSIAQPVTYLRTIEIPLPPLPEQRAIAHILGTLDDKIELNRRMSETLEAMARALFKSWFVDFEPVRWKMERKGAKAQSRNQSQSALASSRLGGFALPPALAALFPARLVDSALGPIPEGWTCVELKDALEIADGRPLPPERRNDGGPFEVFGANGVIGRTDVPSVDTPCVILGKIGTCGSLHRSARSCWVTNNAFAIRAGRSVSLEFAWWLLRGIDFSQFVSGSANPYMPLKNFGHFKVILPNTKLLGEFQIRAGAFRQQVDAMNAESRTLAALRDALLPKLISGEIRVKDAERFLKERGL